MKHLPQGRTNLGDLREILSKRKVIFTGIQNPKGLGNITMDEALRHNAKSILISNSALERTRPESEGWNLMRNWLSDYMIQGDINRVIDLTYDPNSKKGNPISWETEKYNYSIDAEKMFSIALKWLFSIPQADTFEHSGYDVNVYAFTEMTHQNHNSISHHIWARK